ncbi:MAG: acyl-CoA thioesterase [Defluviitaleaceae bacterium]|nr:acyl-CoA thioesterase [Defluviitaleaceae bacterium]
MTPTGKTRSESESSMTELVLPNDANIIGNLLGGRLLHWIDIAGALAATRHAGTIVATVTMDTIEFKYPVKVGNILVLKSYVTWTGRTSIETAVEVVSENPYTGERRFIHKAFIVYVSVDENGEKQPVIPYLPVTDEEKAEFDGGKERKAKRLGK